MTFRYQDGTSQLRRAFVLPHNFGKINFMPELNGLKTDVRTQKMRKTFRELTLSAQSKASRAPHAPKMSSNGYLFAREKKARILPFFSANFPPAKIAHMINRILYQHDRKIQSHFAKSLSFQNTFGLLTSSGNYKFKASIRDS